MMSQSASCSEGEASHCRSSTSSTSQRPPGAGRLNSGSSAESSSTRRPESSSSAAALLPKPQGALNSTARPRRIAVSNRRVSAEVSITLFPIVFILRSNTCLFFSLAQPRPFVNSGAESAA